MKYIFSNCAGIFVFDRDFKVIEKTDISNSDILKIAKGEWVDAEKAVINRYSKEDKKRGENEEELFFVGFKDEKIDGIKTTQDQKKLGKILEYFKNKNFFNRFYEINLLHTKKNVKESVKDDLLLIQAINNTEELDRMANVLSKRLREWYELYNPEFSKSLSDHRIFARNIIANTKEELLRHIKLDKEKSMGADLNKEDFAPIKSLAKEIESLYSLRDEEAKYIEETTERYCPNLKEVAGPLIAAKLISLAGSFKRLAELPSSTTQLLGAEKALFRHMKTGAKPPKYGIIIQHPSIANADKRNKGKAARKLAQKIAIAARRDYFGRKEE